MEVACRGEKQAVLFMRKHLAWYLKGLPGASHLKRKILPNNLPTSSQTCYAGILKVQSKLPRSLLCCFLVKIIVYLTVYIFVHTG